jgi:hypothetical protein
VLVAAAAIVLRRRRQSSLLRGLESSPVYAQLADNGGARAINRA